LGHDFEVISASADKVKEQVPDVITLDTEMPRMDGLTFLQKIMSQPPLSVVICSSLTEKGAETTLKDMEYGAIEIITKPRMETKQFPDRIVSLVLSKSLENLPASTGGGTKQK
jgi:chemotaxis response regulator CheB